MLHHLVSLQSNDHNIIPCQLLTLNLQRFPIKLLKNLVSSLTAPTSTPPPDGLMIFCSVALVNVSNIDVVCGSNRLGEADDVIVLSECLLDGMASVLADFC